MTADEETILAESKARVRRNLLQARKYALSYLKQHGLKIEEIRMIIDAVEEDSAIDVSIVDTIQDLSDKLGSKDIYRKIDEVVVAISEVLNIIDSGIDRLNNVNDMEGFLEVSETCINAYRHLCNGFKDKIEGAPHRDPKNAKREDKREGNVRGGVKSQGSQRAKNGEENYDEFIIKEFIKLRDGKEDVLIVEYPDDEDSDGPTKIPFTIRKKGRMIISGCSGYIYEKYHEYLVYIEEEPMITWSVSTISKKISAFLDEEDEANYVENNDEKHTKTLYEDEF